ncbi:MAG: DUF3943 domain-containing protein [Myxococcaceae bacterium]
MIRSSLLISVLLISAARAQDLPPPEEVDAGVAALPDDAPRAEPVISLPLPPKVEPGEIPPKVKKRYHVLLPIIETEALHFILASLNNLLLRSDFAQVSVDSVASHFDGRRPWEFDVDSFAINQFGHPYQGSIAFTAARSSGLNFWWSFGYAFMASLTWEEFFEIDAPSYNDQITTPLGGTYLGEVLHRTSLLVLREGPGPQWLRSIFAFLIEPVGQLNRWLFSETLDAEDVDEHPPFFAQLGAGANFGSAFRDPNSFAIVQSFAPQVNVQGRVTYGTPGDPKFTYRAPFSHFDLDFNLSAPGQTVVSLFMRGLLYGGQFALGASTRGVYGVFGQYDFSAASLVRISAVSFGFGTSLQTRLSDTLTLQFAGIFSGVPFSSAGSLGLDDIGRDYHVGPGGQVTLEARLIWNDRAWLRVVGRSWFLGGVYVGPTGWESISYVTAGPLVRIWGPLALGADLVMAIRRAKFDDDLFDRSVTGATVRVTLNWVSSESLGAVR